MKPKLKTFLYAILAVALIFGSLFVFKKAPSVASYSYYESLKISPSSLNGNSIWGGTESYDTVVNAGGLDAWAAFYSAARKSSGGLDTSGAISINSVPYNLSWTGSTTYDGNDTIRLFSSKTSTTINLDTIGAYEKLYVLGTAGGPGEGNYANFAVRVHYTDGTSDETNYRLYDWYDSTPVDGVYKWPNLARRLVVKSSSSSYRPSSSSDYSYEGSTSSSPYLQSANITVNPKKLVSSIDLVLTGKNGSSDTEGIYCGIYAITGMVNVSAPGPVETIYVDNVSETTADIHWDSVQNATSYRLDIALDPDFKNILPDYNNRLVNDTSLVAEGLTGDTVYYTRVRAENSEGQSISSNVVSFRTDPETIPPTISVLANPGLIQIKDDATIIAVDASGVKNIEESLDGGETWTLLVEGDRAEREITENGTYCYRATDNYNNTSDKTCITYNNLDTAKPVIRVNTNGYVEGEWTNELITLTVESLTINVGQTRYYYSEDGVNWLDYPGSVVYSGETGLEGKTFYFKAISQAGVESDVVTALVRRDITAPTGEISSADNTWNSFLNTITFGLFFNETKDFSVAATDDLSGVKSVEYLVSNSEFGTTEDALLASGWQAVSDTPVSIDPEGDFILYYKLTDNAGNVAVINTDGVVLDATKALVRGYVDSNNTYALEDGKTYYLTQKIIVTDNRALAEIKINGETVALTENNIIELAGNQTNTYVIEATDKAGNKTVVTVNTGSLADLDLGLNEDNFKTDDKEKLEDAKNKLEGIEANEGSHATDEEKEVIDNLEQKYDDLLDKINELENEIHEEIDRSNNTPDIDHVTSDDRENLEEILGDIKDTLEEDGTHLTIDEINELITEKQELEDKLARLDDVQEKEDDLDIVNQTDVDIIKTNDKEELLELLDEANELLNGNNLTDEERETVEEEKAKIEELLERIEDAEEAKNTDVLEELEQALEDYGNNYTDEERQEIEDKIQEIKDRIEQEERERWEEIMRTTFPTITVVSETERWITSDIAGVSATDDYGVAKLEVSSDNGETWTILTDEHDSSTFEVVENGTYIFRATNEFGNTDEEIVVYHNIDNIKPVVEVDAHGYALGSWTNQPVVLTARNIAENVSPVSLFVREQGTETWLDYTEQVLVIGDTDSKIYEFKAVSAAGLESDIVSAEVKKDSVSPSGEITVGENSLASFLNTITLGLFFNETKEYTLSATDDRSGVEVIRYYVSESELTSAELSSLTDWNSTEGNVSVDPEKEAFIYYQIIDRAGNLAVVGQDGVVFDLPGLKTVDIDFSSTENGYSTLTTGSGETELINDLEHKTVEDKDALEDAKNELEEYLESHNNPEDSLVEQILDDYKQTIEEIEETEREVSEIEQQNEEIPDLDHVTSNDKEEIENLIEKIETTEETHGNHLTDGEKQELDDILDELNDKLTRLEEVEQDLDDVDERVNNYDEETVKKDDLEDLEELRDKIEELENSDNVTSEEKEHLEELKDIIDELEKRIEEAEKAREEAINNDQTGNITPDNVRPEDQTSLEDASQGYAEALGVFDGNFSLLDLFDINNRVNIINSALDVLDQVAEFEAMVSRLPNPEDVNYSYRDAIKAAQLAYSELSEYAKTLVGPSLMTKYRAIVEAYRAFLEGSPLLYAFETLDVFWWALTTFFIVGAFVVITRHTHKNYVEEEADDDDF